MVIMSAALTKRTLSNAMPGPAVARPRAFRRDAEHDLPGKVARVVLFGSRARGDARCDSDYDVAVFVRDLNDRRSIDHILSDAAYRQTGFHIRPVAVPAEYLETAPRDALAMEIIRDGIVVL
jgi:hypothetical protein